MLSFAVTDAIFRPLAARQELRAREFDLQAARNDALLAVAVAYFDVQEARGKYAGTLDTVAKANELVNRITGLSKGLIPEIEVDRARAPCNTICSSRPPPSGPVRTSPAHGSPACSA